MSGGPGHGAGGIGVLSVPSVFGRGGQAVVDVQYRVPVVGQPARVGGAAAAALDEAAAVDADDQRGGRSGGSVIG